MRTLIGFLFAVGTIFTVSVYVAEYEIPLPKPKPVSIIGDVEAKCPEQKLKPRLEYGSRCVHQTVADYKF